MDKIRVSIVKEYEQYIRIKINQKNHQNTHKIVKTIFMMCIMVIAMTIHADCWLS